MCDVITHICMRKLFLSYISLLMSAYSTTLSVYCQFEFYMYPVVQSDISYVEIERLSIKTTTKVYCWGGGGGGEKAP